MSFKLTIGFDTAKELKNFVMTNFTACFAVESPTRLDVTTAGSVSPQEEPPVAEEEPVKKRKARKEKAPAEPLPATVASDEPAIPYAEVQKATMEFHGARGRQATLALLNEFGVKIATALKPEQYPAYLNRLRDLQGAPPARL
jgi:hypothetical protein